MKNRHLIFSLVVVFAIGVITFVSLAPDKVSASVPFGGRVIFKMPQTTQPPPNTAVICPSHSVVFSTSGEVFGLLGGRLYDYRNIFSARGSLGRYMPFELPNCVGAVGVFWPVYPLLFMGTSAY